MIYHLKQSVWALLEYLIYPLLMFASTPFFLEYLGGSNYGLWMLLMALSGFGSFAGLGVGSAVIKEVSYHREDGEASITAKNIIANSLSLAFLGSFLVGVIYLFFWEFAPFSLTHNIGSPEEILLLLFCSFFIISFEQLDSVFSGAIKGYERFEASAKTEITIKCVSILLYISIVYFFNSIFLLFIFVVMVALARVILKGIVASAIVNVNLFSLQWDKKIISRLMDFGKWAWLQSLGSAIFTSADKLIIGTYLGSESVARYSVFSQLAQQIHAITSAAASILFPLISRRFSKGDPIIKIATLGMISVITVAILIALIFYLYGASILNTWLPKSFGVDDISSYYLLLVAYTFLAVTVVPHYVYLGMYRVKHVALSNLLAGLISILLCIYLVESEGISSGAYSKIIYSLILLSIYGYFFKIFGKAS